MKTDFRWYADQHAKAVFDRFNEELKPIIAKLMPGFELSYMGIARISHDFGHREEVILKLHINTIGSVKVVPDNHIEAKQILLAPKDDFPDDYEV